MPHLVYLDEAGIASNDRVTAVAAITVHSDEQWLAAVNEINGVINKHVPQSIRAEGFIPHATDVFEDDYGGRWPLPSRIAYMHDLLYLVEHCSLGLGWGVTRDALRLTSLPEGLTPEQGRHAFAFELCLCQTDRGIREYFAEPQGTAIAICEKNDLSSFLQWVAAHVSRNPLIIPAEPTMGDLAFGVESNGTEQVFRVERMIDTVHFVAKGQAPLMGLADACAWAIKRFIWGLGYAEEYMLSLLSKPSLLEVFRTGTSNYAAGWLIPALNREPGDTSDGPPARLGYPSTRSR